MCIIWKKFSVTSFSYPPLSALNWILFFAYTFACVSSLFIFTLFFGVCCDDDMADIDTHYELFTGISQQKKNPAAKCRIIKINCGLDNQNSKYL